MRLISLFILALLCCFDSEAQSNTAILDRRIDVSFKNEKITTILNRIGQSANFSFSYNSAIISNDDVVSVDGKNLTVREVLNEVFKGSMNYKEKGNHIILTRVTVKAQKSNITSMIISGYVEDWFTNEKIVDASVYEKSSITSVVTDQFGFFRLKLEKSPEKDLVLSISKRDFIDTTIVINNTGDQYFHISLKRTRPISKMDTTSVVSEPDQDSTILADLRAEEITLPYKTSPNVENINDTLHREIQISLLPFIGTNGQLSGNVINDYSINMFGGYSMGTRHIELGFFFNVDRGDVSFLQVAGFGNMNGGNVIGAQGSGFFNVNGGEVKALQTTGFVNVNLKDFQGVQTAGLANINLASADGITAAGFINFSNGRSKGFAVAGFANVHKGDFRGPQIAGFTNIHTQGKLIGTQIGGFFNHGDVVHGTQIGFINYADSLTGVPIGFLSMVKHGYHKLEFSADEVFYTNVAFRSGVKAFYNIISASYNPQTEIFGKNSMWSFGYGVGTARRITRWLDLNIDLSLQHVNKGGFTSDLSELNKLQAGFDFRLAKGFSLYVGGSLNAYVTYASNTDYPVLFSDFNPHVFYSHTDSNDVNFKMWWGGKIALRFF